MKTKTSALIKTRVKLLKRPQHQFQTSALQVKKSLYKEEKVIHLLSVLLDPLRFPIMTPKTLDQSPSLLPCNQKLTEHFLAGEPAERILSWNQLANQQRPPPSQQADLTTKLPASALPYPTLQTITTAVSLHPYLVFNFKLSMHEQSRRYLASFTPHTCLVLLAFHP